MSRLHTHSQHFLRSPALAKELIGHSKIKKGELVIDIGAGSGVITAALAEKGQRVIAVEVEPQALRLLERNTARYSDVTIWRGDFLTMNLPTEPFNIFANIPFSLSSAIIERLITTDTPPEKTYLIVQKQFARKLVATDNRFFTGQLGMLLGIRYDVRIRKPLRKIDFTPPPAVDTVFLEILKRPEPRLPKGREVAYRKMTVECFSDPRKYVRLPLAAIGVTGDVSPSKLTIDQWVELFKKQTIYR